MLIKRIASSIVLIAVAIVTLFFFPDWAFALVVATFIMFGLNEFFALVQQRGIPIRRYVGIILGIMIPLGIFFSFESPDWEPFSITIVFIVVFVSQFTKRTNDQAIVCVATVLFGLLYISWFFSFLIKLKLLPDGVSMVMFLLLVTKSGDIGAYVIGTSFGRHPLIPRISPKKSIEGTVGGFIFSVVVAIISKIFLPTVPLVHLITLGAGLGLLAQLGDLSESLIKRDCGVKDSGRFLPGLGGALDLMDSILFTAPVFYFYVKAFL